MKIVKFVQPNCVQCRVVDGLIKHLGLQVDETLDIAMDEKAYELAVSHGIQSTPTLMMFDGEGNVVDRVSGTNQDAIKAFFAKRG